MALLGKNRHDGVMGIQRRHFNSMQPKGFPQQVADTVLGGLEQAANLLEAMASSWPTAALHSTSRRHPAAEIKCRTTRRARIAHGCGIGKKNVANRHRGLGSPRGTT
jgi:hypothetical protein